MISAWINLSPLKNIFKKELNEGLPAHYGLRTLGQGIATYNKQKRVMAAFDFGTTVPPEQFSHFRHHPVQLDIQRALREGWELFRNNPSEFLGFTLVCFAAWLVGLLFDGGSSIIFSSIAAPLYSGYTMAVFRIAKGESLEFSDFFKGFNYLLPLFLASLACTLFVSFGLMLFILPGIYLAVSYMFTTFFIIDYKMNFWQAMETSRTIITRSWFSFFAFAIVLFIINVAGAFLFGIGMIVSAPVTACAAAVAYRNCMGVQISSIDEE
uniref:Uncharacterized protein n=1 Tax=Chlorobium chlorochromatii (strain CaD3) TaxID=340177 RepID=Q3APN2_CHLCH